jgi:hypothetical protein
MPTPQAQLDLADAIELAEMLTFISQWLHGTDHAQLAASFGRFIGTQGYDLPPCAATWPASPSCSATTTESNSSAPATAEHWPPAAPDSF